MTTPATFVCLACGACCQTKLWAVRVEPNDRTPRYLTRSVRRRMGFASWEADDGVRCMHSVDDRCAALLVYCAKCSRDLCDACMLMGCCGHVPALSGMRMDGDEDMDGDALPATLKFQGCGQDFSEAAPHTFVTARMTQCAACCAGFTKPDQLEPA